jgi:hypothetical protein
MKPRPQFPMMLDLPVGRATHVLGSQPNADAVTLYELPDGTQLPVDTRIPDDLAGRWFWSGCTGLGMVVAPGECGYTIATVTYPPPGVAAPRGRTCYDVARDYEARERALAAPRQEAKQPKPKRKAQAVRDVAAQAEQAVMDL